MRGFEKGPAGLAGSLVLCLSLMISDCTFARDPDQIRFRTPTNRIHCLFSMENGNPGSTALLCDIDQSVVKKPARSKPADCKSDWGRRFQFGNDGGAGLECAPDWVGSNDSQVLAYGTSITGEILCSSDATGLTCKNAKGHGFFPVTTRSTNLLDVLEKPRVSRVSAAIARNLVQQFRLDHRLPDFNRDEIYTRKFDVGVFTT